MLGIRDLLERYWRATVVLALGALLLLPVAMAGCGLLPGFLSQPPLPSATPTPTPTATPTAGPAATSGPAAVTREQAQAIVRAWFEAVARRDYQRAEELTAGDAAGDTRALARAIESALSQQAAQLELAVRRLDLAPATALPRGEAVAAAFEIDVNARIGPTSVTARQLQGSATFVVQWVDGTPKITDIRAVSGLPVP